MESPDKYGGVQVLRAAGWGGRGCGRRRPNLPSASGRRSRNRARSPRSGRPASAIPACVFAHAVTVGGRSTGSSAMPRRRATLCSASAAQGATRQRRRLWTSYSLMSGSGRPSLPTSDPIDSLDQLVGGFAGLVDVDRSHAVVGRRQWNSTPGGSARRPGPARATRRDQLVTAQSSSPCRRTLGRWPCRPSCSLQVGVSSVIHSKVEYRQGMPRRTATTANAILGLLALRRSGRRGS